MVGLVVNDFCVADEVVSGEGLVVAFFGMLLGSTRCQMHGKPTGTQPHRVTPVSGTRD